MDAVDFIKIRSRMCRVYDDCADCPLDFFCEEEYQEQDCDDRAAKAVRAVEQWAKEHPVKTRQSEFLKMFPNVRLESDGMPSICPIVIDKTKGRPDGVATCCIIRNSDKCYSCRRDFWLKEIE